MSSHKYNGTNTPNSIWVQLDRHEDSSFRSAVLEILEADKLLEMLESNSLQDHVGVTLLKGHAWVSRVGLDKVIYPGTFFGEEDIAGGECMRSFLLRINDRAYFIMERGIRYSMFTECIPLVELIGYMKLFCAPKVSNG